MNWKIFLKSGISRLCFPHRCVIFPMGRKYQKISLCGKVAWEEGEAGSANMLISNTTLERLQIFGDWAPCGRWEGVSVLLINFKLCGIFLA